MVLPSPALACFGLQPCSRTDNDVRHADKSFAILEASRRDRLRGHGGRKHSGDPGGLSIPRRRCPAAETAKRMRWVAKMQVRLRRKRVLGVPSRTLHALLTHPVELQALFKIHPCIRELSYMHYCVPI